MYEERCWGSYQIIDEIQHCEGMYSLVKRIIINLGNSISYQSHKMRKEVWTVIDGCGIIVLDSIKRSVKRGDVIDIPMGVKHTIKATDKLTLIEVQMGKEIKENDIEKWSWIW